MRTLKLIFLGTLAACTASATGAGSPGKSGFGWLAGHWCTDLEGEFIEEAWLSPRGNLMLGVGQTVKGGKTVNFEFMRIESDAGDTNYIAQHRAGAPTAFRMTASGENWARFENPAHDFPKRVEYRRTPNGLRAEVAGPGKGGKELVISFEYLACK
ncbi:MAG TPA: DUF6265 family protein [Steroidobacteraceae bacterium]|nr:DUF6265 family protein [Steroidobacteraceae bacterium]